MAKHSKGIKKGKFCALRKSNCGHRQYRKVDVPSDWGPYQAHHLLCVSSVTQFLGKKKEILEVIKKTDWCINTEPNMKAMPVWGQTVRHYCELAMKGQRLKEPRFRDIPQHNYDHSSSKGGFLEEVGDVMQDLANQVEEQKEEYHEGAERSLEDELRGWSRYFADQLERRGKRSGGTHKGWLLGRDTPTRDSKDSKWYEPFSMADDGHVDPRQFPFPRFNTEIAKRILNGVMSYWGK